MASAFFANKYILTWRCLRSGQKLFPLSCLAAEDSCLSFNCPDYNSLKCKCRCHQIVNINHINCTPVLLILKRATLSLTSNNWSACTLKVKSPFPNNRSDNVASRAEVWLSPPLIFIQHLFISYWMLLLLLLLLFCAGWLSVSPIVLVWGRLLY